MEPGLETTHVMQVPTGGQLPTADGRVQMYPCFAFEFHLILVAVDPDLGKPEIRRYFIGHDCGTVINPKIVRGMTMGGIAHGIGAALYEEFAYNEATAIAVVLLIISFSMLLTINLLERWSSRHAV